jgi:Ca-activated chloride channel family protein
MSRRSTLTAALALLAATAFCRSSEPDPSVRIVPPASEPAAPPDESGAKGRAGSAELEAEQDEEGGSGARAAGAEGIVGYGMPGALLGPKDNPNPHLAGTQMLEFGLGDVGKMGHGYGAGNGVGFGRGGARMGRGYDGTRRGPSAGGATAPRRSGYARGRGGPNAADTPALDCADADEVVVVADDGDGPMADDDSATQGTLRAKTADGEPAGEFPLRHTEVAAEISGFIARTDVEQTYTNPFREVIEAVYVFPLPALGAVNDFVMEVGGRKIVGLIRPREEAERIYAEARARGQTASLLTQERPNVFTQSVANIEPGGEVKIRITYFERLGYERGEYEWVFPMVVGPRYVAGQARPATDRPADPATGTATAGGGTAAPTDRVPDADRITPPVLHPGERSGHDIGLTVTLDAGLPIAELRAAVHQVDIVEESTTRRVVKLRAADSIPNKDFVLRWSVAGADTQFGVLAHRGEQGGFFTLMMQPPAAPTDAQVTPREITFLLDISGSMRGLPLAISKSVVERTLDRLRPDDSFNLFYFASGNGQLWDKPKRRSDENVAEAKEFLAELEGGGGTEMLAGVRRALEAEHDPAQIQLFVFATDGFIGEEQEILRLVETGRGAARFFMFGIGSSVNRDLVDGIAEHGGGASEVVLPDAGGDACRAVDRLFAAIDSPVLVDVKIDWNGLPVEDVYPARLPDLFAGQTINVVGRYKSAAAGTAYVEARVGTRELRLPVSVVLPEAEAKHAALAPIWARWRIDELTRQELTADEDRRTELKRQITELAVEFRLVSAYTAFVAVDESRVVGDGRPLRIIQPVELPAGVSYEGVFGETPTGEAYEVAAWGLTVQATESGKLKVGRVADGSAARRAGIEPGAEIRTVNRTAVHDVTHLEGLLLQSSGSVRLELDPGGAVDLPAL